MAIHPQVSIAIGGKVQSRVFRDASEEDLLAKVCKGVLWRDLGSVTPNP
jgi:hypothetical protein